MPLRYAIKARARRELERAAEWWAGNRLSAPGAVRTDLEGVLFILVHHPGLGQNVETVRSVPVRRYLMSKTQHWLYYRVKGEVLEVLSVWSTNRGRVPKV